MGLLLFFLNLGENIDDMKLSEKFVQLVSKRISETFGLCHSIEGAF